MAFELKIQLLKHLNSLFEEGLLNDQFHQYEILRDAHSRNSGLLSRAITTFLDGTEKLLAEADNLLNADRVDFSALNHTARRIKGSSSVMGVQNLKQAILPLLQHCRATNKDGCKEALRGFMHEYQYARGRLETIVQLDQIILQYEQK